MIALEFFTWLAALSSGAISVMVFVRRPPAPLWPSLFFVTFFAMLWSLGEAGSSYVSSDPSRYWFWIAVEYTGVLFLPATWWLCTLRFAELQGHRPRWAGNAARLVPCALGGVFWIAMISNPIHGQFMTPVVDAHNEFHPIWYAQAMLAYALMTGVLGLIAWMHRATRSHILREQLLIIFAASLVPLICNAIYVSRIVDSDVGLTAAGLGVSMVLFLMGVYRDQLFGLSSLSMRQLIEHDTDGMLILDRKGRLRHFNPAASRLLAGEVLTPDLDLVTVLASHLRSPDGRVTINAEALARELASPEQPQGGHIHPFDGPHCRWLGIEVIPIPDRTGRRRGTGLRLRDVTALQEAQEKVVEQATVLEAVLGSAEQGILVMGRDGEMIYWNRAFQHMWSIPDEILETQDEKVALPYALGQVSDPETFAEKIRELDQEPSAESREEVRLLDGRVFERASRPLLQEGEIVGRVWSFFDVTGLRQAEKERKLLEQRMQQAQKLESLGILAGGIAHDFNNLLVGILGNADLLLMTAPPDAASRGPLQDIVDSSQRASELTNQMLAYSGKGSFVFDAIDVVGLVENTGHLLEAVISKNARLELALEAVPRVDGDATQLRQVVMNLITNASDALDGDPGNIRVATRMIDAEADDLADYHFGDSLVEGPYVCIEVADTGCGMDEETVARIFDPFFTTKFTGRGLGLAAVLGIVRAHRGAIEVESTPGRGTTFRLLLPPSREMAVESGVAVRSDSAGLRGRGTVLVVDDEPSIRRLVGRALERAGYDVVLAKNGREALSCFPEHADEIVVILLDLTMPDMGGEETFTALRALGAEAPIVLSSGYSEREVRAGFEGAGPSAFLHKPFTTAALLEVLKRVLEAPD